MTLLQNASSIGYGIKTSFVATGGTAPYTYSVVSGGGSIDSNGIFTAPAFKSEVVVKAIDSLNVQVTASIRVLPPILLLADIIQNFMGLADDQIYLYNQKINVPPDMRPYVAIKIPMVKPFSNTIKYDGSGSGLDGIQEASFNCQIMIDILSRSTDALDRKEELLMSFGSVYAKQQQELNGFSVARISASFISLSEIEGAAIPYRFNINVGLQYTTRKVLPVSYYDTFQEPFILTNS